MRPADTHQGAATRAALSSYTRDVRRLSATPPRPPGRGRRWIGPGLALVAILAAYLLAQRVTDEGEARAVADYQAKVREAIAALPRCEIPRPNTTRVELLIASDDGTSFTRQCMYISNVAGMQPRVRMVTAQ